MVGYVCNILELSQMNIFQTINVAIIFSISQLI